MLTSPPASQKATPTAWVLLGFAAAVAVLHFAEDVLIPVALAVLLSFLLAPLVAFVERRGLPRAVAVGVTALLAFALIGGLVWTVAHQFVGLVEDLPFYRDTLLAKLRMAMPGEASGALERGVATVKEISDELQKDAPLTPGEAASAPEVMTVRVLEPPPSVTQTLRSLFGPLIAPAGTAAIVIVFVVFMLVQREDLRDRLVRLLGAGSMHATVAALDDAAQRVSRYLQMQVLINTLQGLLVAGGLAWIGVPDALLWGALTVVLRFIPYLGPVLAAAGPIAVAVAFLPGWTEPLMVIGWIVTLELVSNNLLEPRLYGASVGVSSFALIVAAVFWTWLWGIAGLFLATPLTVCLVVMGKYIPQLGFLSVMLGDQPVLRPHERFYQRLLANDPDEAQDLIDEAVAEAGLLDTADTMLLPALRLAEHDHARGAIDPARREAIVDQIGVLIDDLPPAVPAADAPPDTGARMKLVCLPAADRADEVVALVLARLLAPLGIDAEVLPAATLKGEMLERVVAARPDAICISAAPPAAVIHARYLCKKLAECAGGVPVIVGLWDAQGDLGKATDRLAAVGADRVVATAADAVKDLTQRLQALRQLAPAADDDQPVPAAA